MRIRWTTRKSDEDAKAALQKKVADIVLVDHRVSTTLWCLTENAKLIRDNLNFPYYYNERQDVYQYFDMFRNLRFNLPKFMKMEGGERV